MSGPPPSPPLSQSQVDSLLKIRRGRASFGVAIRAAIATVTPVLLAQFLHQPIWIWAALGAYTTCLADVLDTYEGKLRMSVVVTVGSAVVAVIGAIGATGPAWAVVALTFAVAFLGSAARALGRVIGTASYFILVTFVVALGAPAQPGPALVRGGYVLLGGVWATMLILSRWIVEAQAPVLSAAAFPYAGLARLARLILRQERAGARAERAALREHRNVRDAVTIAHEAIAHMRPGAHTEALHAVVDDADRLFGVVLALGEAIRATSGADHEHLQNVAAAVERLTTALEQSVARGVEPGVDVTTAAQALRTSISDTSLATTAREITILVTTLQRTATNAIESATLAAAQAASAALPHQHSSRPASQRRLWLDRLRTVRDHHVTPESP
ncbi:MAG TPA: hypothetical protein VGT98_08895, partial [Candidatus Elarobacter sp.]|nr:hypothetical protein [Candidatus Elarobacter sp.]